MIEDFPMLHFMGIGFQVAEGASGSIGGYVENEDLSAMVFLADQVEDAEHIHFCNCVWTMLTLASMGHRFFDEVTAD